jgi:protein SCO1/2
MVSERLRLVQEEFKNDPRFQIVSFSVDPKNDTPARLKKFGLTHGANSKVWSFLRPEDKPLRELMAKGFKLGTLEDPLYHTAKVVVMNKGNVVAEYFDGDSNDVVPKVQAKVRALLQ